MQVVYSGGSNTPTPSPRLQRKTGYGRPVMPGYMTHVHPQILVHRSREKLTEGDTTLRDSIPAMSRGVAITCLVLNLVIPGSGTLISGLSVLCCSQVRPKHDSKRHCIWVNAGVGLLQFLLTFLFLLGWIWSITWGLAFLAVSKQFYHRDGERLSDGDGTKKRSKEHAERYAGPLHSLQQHGQSPAGSRAGSCNSLNRIATDNARAAHDKDAYHHNQHYHHNHETDSHRDHRHHHDQNHLQHYQRQSSGARNVPHNTHHDGNKHQHDSRQDNQHQRQHLSTQQNHHHHCHQQPHHNHEQNSHAHRNNHYQQEKSKFHERLCLHPDANDDIAVIPPEEPGSEPEGLYTERQNQSSSSAISVKHASSIVSAVSRGTEELTKNSVLASKTLTEDKHDAPGVSPVPTLPNAVISESESATNSTPVLTIPVPPHPHHHQKRRHNEHVALQPIITLQRVPENSPDSHTDGVLNARGPYSQAPEEKVMRARTRHEKMLQRKMSDNDLSPFVLTNQQLAAIIIHDLPIQAPGPSGSAQDQTGVEGLPKC